MIGVRGIIALVAASLLIISCAAGASVSKTPGQAPANGPSLVTDKETIDYGLVKYNEWVRPVFQLRNTGDTDLVVKNVTIETLEGC
jgi:hypothetical protein